MVRKLKRSSFKILFTLQANAFYNVFNRTLTYPFDLTTWILIGLSCLSMILALSMFSFNIRQNIPVYLNEDLSFGAYRIFTSSLVPIIHVSLPQQTIEILRLKSRYSLFKKVWTNKEAKKITKAVYNLKL